MNIKLISAGTISLCLASFSILSYAQNYYSSQPANGGYYTSASNNDNDNDGGRKKLQWRLMVTGSPIPPNAVAGGEERGQELYVCRARYNGGVHPGKVVGATCNFGWGGKEVTTADYEILSTNAQLEWVPASDGYVPPGAVKGGHENNHSPLYICQIRYLGGMHPGKLTGQTCNIGWGGREISKFRYNVLVR